jgi:hypothetical protein
MSPTLLDPLSPPPMLISEVFWAQIDEVLLGLLFAFAASFSP